MTGQGSGRVRLVDAPEESGRSTATLVASLAARLSTLYAVSGAAAVGSMVSGFAAIGREASKTVEGARLRQALERGRVATNGDALWSTLRIRQWASLAPASPLLEQMANDMALLLSTNLEETLALLPIPGEPAGASGTIDEPPAEFLDCIVGMWAHSRAMIRSIEALAGQRTDDPPFVEQPERPTPPDGSILR